MANIITIIRPGTPASLGDIHVVVLAAVLRGSPPLVQYEIGWFCNGDRKTAWVEAFELANVAPSGVQFVCLS